jgi:PPOX class probable F420-dependent enzyme
LEDFFMPLEISPEQAEMIQNAYHLWLTTVRADGMPQPTPIWFVWENDSILLYSKPDAQKVRNIRQNPKVALSFNRDTEAEEYVVIMGEAVFDESAPPSHEHQAFSEKYADGVKGLGWTAEEMSGMFSLAIRVTPRHVRSG